MNFELKPCPFCGGEAEFFEDEFFCRYSVVCTECGAGTDTYGVERDAMDAWNRRIEPTFAPDELDIISRYMRQDFDGKGTLERAILKKCNYALKGGER